MINLLGQPSRSLSDKTKNIATAFVIKLIWVIPLSIFLSNLKKADLILQTGRDQVEPEYLFFMACVWAPIWEEVAYRWAPITVAKRFGEDLIWPVIVISSLLFGWIHGNGPVSLLIQGVGGVMLSFLYLKNNYSLLSSMVLHSMWNIFVIFIL